MDRKWRSPLALMGVFALLISMLALPAAAAAEPCQTGGAYDYKYDVPDSDVPGSVPIMVDVDGQQVQVGTIFYNTPGTGQLTIALDKGAEITALCVFGGNDRQEFTSVGDGFVTEPLLNAPDNPAGVSNFAWTVTYEPPDEPINPEGTLAVEKDAFGSYEQARTWSLDKFVLDAEGEWVASAAFSGNPGDTFPIEWRSTLGLRSVTPRTSS